jgi:hypothetical protein
MRYIYSRRRRSLPHAVVNVSAYSYICVRATLYIHVDSRTKDFVPAGRPSCVLILLHVCAHAMYSMYTAGQETLYLRGVLLAPPHTHPLPQSEAKLVVQYLSLVVEYLVVEYVSLVVDIHTLSPTRHSRSPPLRWGGTRGPHMAQHRSCCVK